jgi:hypothetical protein
MSRASYDHPHDSGSTRACDVVQDFAFADTVVCDDLEEAAPPSGIVVSDEHSITSYPLGYEPQMHAQMQMQPMQMLNVPMPPPEMTLWDRLLVWLSRSREEMALLWSATGNLEHVHDGQGAIVYEEDPLARAATVGRRVRTLWSFFEWDRADLVRAAWIGLLVFVLAATVGAFVLGSSTDHGPTSQGLDNVSSRTDLR